RRVLRSSDLLPHRGHHARALPLSAVQGRAVVEHAMNPRLLSASVAALLALTAASASAQDRTASQPSLSPVPTRAWVVVGGASTSSLSSCEDCVEDPATYRHTGSVTANVGASINPRTDVGAEMLLVTAS